MTTEATPVSLHRIGSGIDRYNIEFHGYAISSRGAVIPENGTMSSVPIDNMSHLVDVYAHQRDHLISRKDDEVVSFCFGSTMLVMSWDVACALYLTIEAWFWDLADSWVKK